MPAWFSSRRSAALLHLHARHREPAFGTALTAEGRLLIAGVVLAAWFLRGLRPPVAALLEAVRRRHRTGEPRPAFVALGFRGDRPHGGDADRRCGIGVPALRALAVHSPGRSSGRAGSVLRVLDWVGICGSEFSEAGSPFPLSARTEVLRGSGQGDLTGAGGLASGHGCSPLRHPMVPTANHNPARASPNALFPPPCEPPTHQPTRPTHPYRLNYGVESPILRSKVVGVLQEMFPA